jgi:hypothetical protein
VQYSAKGFNKDDDFSEYIILNSEDLSSDFFIQLETNNSCGNTYNLEIKTERDGKSINSSPLKISFINRKSPSSSDFDPEEPPVVEISPYPINGEIWVLEHLAYIDTNSDTLNGSYKLMRDLNFLDDDSYYEPNINKTNWTGENGMTPIGSQAFPFTGIFNGNNHMISNLYIYRPNTENIGLFGYINNAQINNLRVNNLDVYGNCFVGGLVGYAMDPQIYNTYTTGTVSGNLNDIFNGNQIGGLIGFAVKSEDCDIFNNFSTVSVIGNSEVGGLIGSLMNCDVLNNFAIGAVYSKEAKVGGLIGWSRDSIISKNYSTATVNCENCEDYEKTEINCCIGGFIGHNYSNNIFNNNYWDINVSTNETANGNNIYGKTTTQMKQRTTFIGWDFTDVWAIDEGESYPYLISNVQST